MKRTRLLTLALSVLIFAFIGCSSDDDDNGEFNIVGTWNIDKIENFLNGVLVDTDEDGGTVTFNADGTGVTTDEFGTEPFSWTISGNILTIVDDEGTMVLTLTTMTSTRMVGEFEGTIGDDAWKMVITLTKV